MESILFGIDTQTNEPFHIPNNRLATKKGFFLGQSEAGKTWAASVVIEGLMDLGITVIVFDLVDMHSGLALDKEGKRPAYPVAIFGGKLGHYPLTADMGSTIAKTIYKKRWSTVINLSRMSEEEQYRVVADIVRKTYELHEDKPQRTVLVFEEFHRFLPETLTTVKNHATVSQEIVRASDMGRNFGLGMIGISLRPQDIRKRVLAQADYRMWMRMNELGAVKTARDYLFNAAGDSGKEYSVELPAMPTGTGIFESPSWMKVVAKVKVGVRKTFHRDPESDFVMDDTVVAQAVDIKELRKVFAGFEVEQEEQPITEKKKTASRKDTTDSSRELEALRIAYDELKEEKDSLERDTQQRVHLAEVAATRDAKAQLGLIQSNINQAISLLQSLVANDGYIQQVSSPASANGLSRLQRQVENHKSLKPTHRLAMEKVIEEYVEYQRAISYSRLASAMGIRPDNLENNVLPTLRKAGYIKTSNRAVEINPEML